MKEFYAIFLLTVNLSYFTWVVFHPPWTGAKNVADLSFHLSAFSLSPLIVNHVIIAEDVGRPWKYAMRLAWATITYFYFFPSPSVGTVIRRWTETRITLRWTALSGRDENSIAACVNDSSDRYFAVRYVPNHPPECRTTVTLSWSLSRRAKQNPNKGRTVRRGDTLLEQSRLFRFRIHLARSWCWTRLIDWLVWSTDWTIVCFLVNYEMENIVTGSSLRARRVDSSRLQRIVIKCGKRKARKAFSVHLWYCTVIRVHWADYQSPLISLISCVYETGRRKSLPEKLRCSCTYTAL